MIRYLARGACCAFVSLSAFAGEAYAAANPMGLAYKTTTNVALYGKPTGMIITGRCNRNEPAFQTVRTKGGEVLVYLIPTTRPDHHVCAVDEQFYMNDYGRVPLWPYPSYGMRENFASNRLTDMRAGSEWVRHVVSFIEKIMRENKYDGVFLDSVGARPWGSLLEYGSWSTAEKNAWTDGNVDLVRRLDAKRRQIRPGFIIVNNNVWNANGSRGLAGEKYVDGIMLEQPRTMSLAHKRYVAKPFGNLGHRRVIVLANTREEARAWAKVPGVTHVGAQPGGSFAYPPPPVVPFSPIRD